MAYINCRWSCVKPKDDVMKLIYDMIYDDAESFWGHRDSLLDPCNNKVSIAAAWGNDRLYLAVYMVSQWAQWNLPPRYDPNTGVFEVRGVIKLRPDENLEGFGPFYSIFIYRDVPKPEYYYSRSYTIGKPYAGVLPREYSGYYVDAITIHADKYVIRQLGDRWYVDISFKLDLPKDGALYTVVMFSAPTGAIWKPYGDTTRLKSCTIFEYTIKT